MKTINDYIIEKLKINKEVKSNEYISGKEMFSFLKHYIFDQIHKVNKINLSTFESFLTSFDRNDDGKFNIECLPIHKQIWGANEKFNFITYNKEDSYMDIKTTDNLYLGGGIYIWFNDGRNKIIITISDNQFNDFDHGFPEILINRK